MAPGEFITAVTLPKPLGGTHIYRKVRDRASYAFALVSVGAIVQRDGTGRIAVGGIAHKPWRVEAAETDMPRGAKQMTADLLDGAKPTGENAFKLTLVERTLSSCAGRSKRLNHEIRNSRQINPIDQLKIVGHPTDRIDGPLKTTGMAHYAYERHGQITDPAYGYVVGSPSPRANRVDRSRARRKPRRACSRSLRPRMPESSAKGDYNSANLLGGPDIEHYHQAVAVVVAETFEQARAAAELVRIEYSDTNGAFDLSAAQGHRNKTEGG